MEAQNLPAIITRASSRLLNARDSAEVLEAKNMAEAALHYAKVTKAANETHADCLRIITRAEMRMANEIDRGQASGEVARRGNPKARASGNSKNKGSDEARYEGLGVTSQRVAEWRKIRDAGEEKVEAAISGALKEGRAPTKSDIRRVVFDPEFQQEAEAAARDLEMERDERIALAGADGLVAENERLTKRVQTLELRISSLNEEISEAKRLEKMWKKRALAAGWKGKERADA